MTILCNIWISEANDKFKEKELMKYMRNPKTSLTCYIHTFNDEKITMFALSHNFIYAN